MARILVVSASAPPKTGPESIQTYKYLKILKQYHAITLATTYPLSYGWKKADLTLDLKIKRINIKVIKHRILNSLLTSLLKRNNWFDENNVFLRSDKCILRQLKDDKIELIYSRSTPFSSAKLAYKLKKALRVPWIMHLSDPWTDSTYFASTQKEREWEEKCFDFADLISLTSEEAIKFYNSKYPHHSVKFRLSTNVYDIKDKSSYDLEKLNKLRLVFTGNQYKNRNCIPIIKAIKKLSKEKQKDLIFDIYGYCDEFINDEIKSQNCDNVNLIGNKSYEEVKKELPKSHVLLSVDRPVQKPVDLIYLPSKLSDYLLAQRKIINITSPNSASDKLIQEKKIGKSFRHQEVSEISQYLSECLKKWNSGDISFFIPDELDHKYDVNYNVLKLKSWIDNLIQGK